MTADTLLLALFCTLLAPTIKADQGGNGEGSIAFIVSGQLSRLIPASIDSLAQNAIRPQVESGIVVDVFAVLQRGRSVTHKAPEIEVSASREDGVKRRFMQAMTDAGVHHVVFLVLDQPKQETLMQYLPNILHPAFQKMSHHHKYFFPTSNLPMFYNMKEGISIVKAHEALARDGRFYSLYVRTRPDNFLFNRHESYSRYMAIPSATIFPRCCLYPINDRYMIFTTSLAAEVFYNVLNVGFQEFAYHWPKLQKIFNPESLWRHVLLSRNITLLSDDASKFGLSHVSMKHEGRLCYHIYHSCLFGGNLSHVTHYCQ